MRQVGSYFYNQLFPLPLSLFFYACLSKLPIESHIIDRAFLTSHDTKGEV